MKKTLLISSERFGIEDVKLHISLDNAHRLSIWTDNEDINIEALEAILSCSEECKFLRDRVLALPLRVNPWIPVRFDESGDLIGPDQMVDDDATIDWHIGYCSQNNKFYASPRILRIWGDNTARIGDEIWVKDLYDLLYHFKKQFHSNPEAVIKDVLIKDITDREGVVSAYKMRLYNYAEGYGDAIEIVDEKPLYK